MNMNVTTAPPQNLGRPLPIRWSQIEPDPDQPRKIFEKNALLDLADNIETFGQETPVKVRTHHTKKGKFLLNDGERRWRAFGIIGERHRSDPTLCDPIMDAFIEVSSDDPKTRLRKQIIANLHRLDLHPLDEGASLKRLHDQGDTIEDLMRLRNKSRTYIENYLRLCDLPEKVKEFMDPDRPKDLQLSVTSAIDIARDIPKIDPALRIAVATEALERNLGVIETRSLIGMKTGRAGYQVGGAMRRPSEDYRVFASFLGRTRRDAKRLNEHLDLDEIYQYRADEDVDIANDRQNLRYIIQQLEAIDAKLAALKRK